MTTTPEEVLDLDGTDITSQEQYLDDPRLDGGAPATPPTDPAGRVPAPAETDAAADPAGTDGDSGTAAALAPPAMPSVPEPSTRWLTWGLTTENGGLADIAGYLAYAAFTDGREPYAFSVAVNSFKKGAWRLPEGGRVLRSFDSKNYATQVVVGDGWTLQFVRWHNRAGMANVTAVTPQLAEEIARTAARNVSRRIKADDDTVRMGFWHHANVAQRQVRAIEGAPWETIRRNYAHAVARQIDQVMSVTSQDVAGRLLLLHGPPGTGKTSALRSLGLAWQSWCRIDCVLDPERLFADPGYLMQVVMGAEQHGSGKDARKWRLLILEDCDELVRGTAKDATGQALSRLLNLTDGLLGQGQNVLVAITTNEELGRLHPAVVRPGRCLAQIEVGPLPQEEAAAWLDDGAEHGAHGKAGDGQGGETGAERPGEDKPDGDEHTGRGGRPAAVTGPMTLAELYALKAGRKAAAGALAAKASTGLYM